MVKVVLKLAYSGKLDIIKGRKTFNDVNIVEKGEYG